MNTLINPVAFQVFGWPVHWYGLLIGLGITFSYYLVMREAKQKGVSQDMMADLLFWTIIWGVVGARAYYVLFRLDYYLTHPDQIIQMWHGGGAIYGAILAGIVCVFIMGSRHQLDVRLIFDIAAPAILLAQAIGRWGNFINQEAYGAKITLNQLQQTHLPQWLIDHMWIDGAYRQPTFLYESMWSLLGFILLLILRKKPHFLRKGEVAASYLGWYAFGRSWIEGLRTDSLYLGSWRISQILSFILIGLAISYVYMNRRGILATSEFYQQSSTKE